MVEFTGKNYWEAGASPKERALAMLLAAGNPNPNPNPGNGMNLGSVIAPAPAELAGPQGAAAVQAQQGPVPEDDLSRLVKEVVAGNADNPGVYPWSRPVDPIGLMNSSSAYVPGTATPKPRVNPVKPSSGGAFDGIFGNIKNIANSVMNSGIGKKIADEQSIKGAMGNAISGIFDTVNGIVDQATQPSPMDIYEQIRKSTPGYSYGGPSAKEMADEQFNPLFQMLSEAAAHDKTEYEGARERAKQSYAGFIKDLLADQSRNQAAYTQAGKEIGASGDTAAKSVTDNTTASAKALAKELNQLGIQEGAGSLLSQNQGELTKALGRLNENRQTASNLNSQLKANAYRADTATQDISRQAGLNYQADLYDNYLDELNANDQQRLQLQGQRGQAQNEYGLQIQDLIAKATGQRDENINDIFKTMMDNQTRQQQFGIDQQRAAMDQQRFGLEQQRFGLDQDKFGLQVQQSQISKDPNANAFRTLQNTASKYFGNDQEAAAAANTLLNALRQAPNATDIGTLLAQIPEEELRKPYMSDLAYSFFNSVLNNKGL